MVDSLTLIIVDDHPLFRTALREAVGQALGGDTRCIEADSFSTAQQAAEQHPDADLLLLDLHLPGAHGYSALIHLRSQYPALPVVVVSARTEAEVIRRAMAYGAAGFIPKSSNLHEIGLALRQVLDGGLWWPPGVDPKAVDEAPDAAAGRLAQLTPQQFRVLMMLSEGLLNKQIAYELGVSEATVKAHVTAILRKLRVSNRTQAVVVAREMEVEMPGGVGSRP